MKSLFQLTKLFVINIYLIHKKKTIFFFYILIDTRH